jgi:hypothetical protein
MISTSKTAKTAKTTLEFKKKGGKRKRKTISKSNNKKIKVKK